MKFFCFLLGKPTSGKGTQIRKIHKSLGGNVFSTGDALKMHVANNSELGRKIKEILNRGMLVSDDIVMEMFEDFTRKIFNDTSEQLALIDGFPRTVGQYEMLNSYLKEVDDKISCVFIYFDIEDEVVKKRFGNRLICSSCYSPFSMLTTNLKEENRCPACGEGTLIKRDDDSSDIVEMRIQEYKKMTAPMVSVIEKHEKSRFFKLDASKTPKEIYSKLEELLVRLGNSLQNHGNNVNS